jgi:hypothetical protein
MKASLARSPCERLTAATHGSPWPGRFRWSEPAVLDPDALGAAADQPPPDQAQRRRADDAEQRRSPGDEREIHGEFAAAGDELLGAVERIDQEEAAAIGRACRIDPLFRQHRDFGREVAQSIGDNPVGGEISLRDRGTVRLALDRHRAAVDGQNGLTRAQHQLSERLHQSGGSLAIDHALGSLILIHRPFSTSVAICHGLPLLAGCVIAVYQASKEPVIRLSTEDVSLHAHRRQQRISRNISCPVRPHQLPLPICSNSPHCCVRGSVTI